MRIKNLVVGAALSLLTVAGAVAQEHPNVAKGTSGPGGFTTEDIDTINLFNGNLSIRLPIGNSYPVNAGFSYQLSLIYNSQVWEHEMYDDETRAVPARGANAGLGWNLHMGRLNPPQLDNTSFPSPDFHRNTYLAPDGALHTFYPTLHEGESAAANTEYTRDGTYMRLKTNSVKIELPDGATHTFSSLVNGYLTRMEDRFGNFVQVDYFDCNPSCVAVTPSAAHRWRITDTQGRTHWVHLKDTGQQGQPLVVTQVDLQAFGGARALYKLIYNDSTDDQSTTGSPAGINGCGAPAGTSNHLAWFLTRLVLPDSSAFEMPKAGYFAYNVPATTTTPCKTGLINRLRLPTQGQIEWDYMLYKFPSISTTRNIWQKSTGVGVRRLLDAASVSIGQWTYTTALSGGTTAHEKLLTNSVADPLGNKVTRYYSVCVNNCSHADGPYEYGLPVGRDSGGDGAGRFLSAQVFDGASTTLRTSYARFEHDAPSASTTVQERRRLNQRLASNRMVFNDDPSGTYADETLSNFDGLGHYRSRQLDGNFPGVNARSSYVDFNSSTGTYGQPGYVPWPAASPWVINNHLFAWDSESGKIQYRISCFDPNTGFLNRRRILRDSGATESAADLLEVYQQVSGNVTVESYYGGDKQALGANACAMALPASPAYQYNHSYSGGVRSLTTVSVGGNTLRTLDLVIDSSTGLTSTSKDTAGKATDFLYDTRGRLTRVDPTDDLLTVQTFCTANSVPACPAGVRGQVVSSRKATVAGAEVTSVRSRYDDWGRQISEEERTPPAGNFVTRSMGYNALGWKTYESEQGSANGTTYLNFDAFGRPRTIRPADGSAHDVTLSYQGVRQVNRTVKVATSTASETNATTIEIYDRHGRLYEITEPNNVKTRHDYDVGNRLVKVCQGATGAGTSPCGQARVFNYDLRGFLTSEQHPEKGAAGNGTVSYFGYDARGHAGRRIDGPHDLTFTYDKAERLTEVRETGGAQRVLKSFFYAGANSTNGLGVTDYRKGKLVSSSRFNYIGAPFNATAEVRDTVLYEQTEGRASSVSRQLVFNGVDEEKFTTTYAYDSLGMVSTLGYPDCVFGDCVALDTPRSVSFTYSYGRLVSVPGVTGTAGGVSQITYHSNGLLNQVPHANGVLYTQQNGGNGLPRTGGITAVRGATTLWSTGSYAYDGTGSVKAIGSNTFVYDSLSRITQGNLTGGSQTYTYDNYGNIQSVTTGGSLVNTPTSSSTNRLTSGTYDSAGNLIGWNGNTYGYDAFNQLVRYTSGAEDWVYMYGPDDERFWSYRTAGGGSIWSLRGLSGQLLRQYNAHTSWGTYQDYVYRDGAPLANFLSNGQQRHFDVDHLGTVRLVTDAAGNQVGFHTYYPFGKEQTALQEGEILKFTGHERDLGNLAGDGDDLDYMHARHASPLTGRFLSVDPAVRRSPSAQPQAWNRYSYALKNPLSTVDRNGRWSTKIHNRIIQTAFPSLSSNQIKILQDMSKKLDGPMGQMTFMSYTHAMRAPGQTPEQAKVLANIFVNTSMAMAHALQKSHKGGGISDAALSAFGAALHTMMDSLSPTHKGFQEWNPFSLRGVLQHAQGEKTISDTQLAEAVALAQSMFNSIFSVKVSQTPTSSTSSIVTSISEGPEGGLQALFSFGGDLYIDGINLTGVFYY